MGVHGNIDARKIIYFFLSTDKKFIIIFFHSTNKKFIHITLFPAVYQKIRLQKFRSMWSPEQNPDQMSRHLL